MKYLKIYEDIINDDYIVGIDHYEKLSKTPDINISISEDPKNIVILIYFSKFKTSTKHFINKASVDNKHKIVTKSKSQTNSVYYAHMKDEEFDKLEDFSISLLANKYNL